MRWTQAQPQGRARKPCEGHTVSVIDTCIYVLFGKHEDDAGNVVCPPLQMLDTVTMALSQPHIAEIDGRSAIPDDREGHTASVLGTKIYVFGGTWTDEEDNAIYMNDLHTLDVSSFTWEARRPAASGSPPIEREGHTASVLGHLIWFFAGTWVDDDDNSVYLNDLHTLDTDTLTWASPRTQGEAPMQREGHSASVVGARLFVFGGAGLDKNTHRT